MPRGESVSDSVEREREGQRKNGAMVAADVGGGRDGGAAVGAAAAAGRRPRRRLLLRRHRLPLPLRPRALTAPIRLPIARSFQNPRYPLSYPSRSAARWRPIRCCLAFFSSVLVGGIGVVGGFAFSGSFAQLLFGGFRFLIVEMFDALELV